MKIFCMHIKLFLCIIAALVLLGIITVSPCGFGESGSVLGRTYGIDGGRGKELCSLARNKLCSLCKK